MHSIMNRKLSHCGKTLCLVGTVSEGADGGTGRSAKMVRSPAICSRIRLIFTPSASHSYFFQIVFSALLLVVGPLVTSQALAQDKIGYVFELKGKWLLEGSPNRLLSTADSLPPGGVISFLAPDGVGPSRIVIHNRVGKLIESRECETKKDCNPISLPRSTQPESSLLGRVFSTVMDILHRDPQKYKAAITRGSRPLEAVLKLSGETIDLSVPFREERGQEYLLQFISEGREQVKPLFPIVFNSGKSLRLVVPGIKAGLYKIQLLDIRSRLPLGPSDEVWVLAVESEDYYAVASAGLKEIMSEARQWQSPVTGRRIPASGKAVIGFLRAYLSYLDGEMPR